MTTTPDSSCSGILLVANYDSNTGFAWWLMESFWIKLAEHYGTSHVFLAYPHVSELAVEIESSPLDVVEIDFTKTCVKNVIAQCKFLKQNQIKLIYFSDMPTWHWRYLFFRLFGVEIIIVHDHTPGVKSPVKGVRGIAKRALHKLPGVSVNGAIGATEFIRQRLVTVSGMPEDCCYVAPNGLPPVRHTLESIDLHRLFDLPKNRLVMIMTGRAHRYKGVGFALEAISLLDPSDLERIHFMFIGSGPDLQYFQQIACELNLESNCTFTGYRNDVLQLLNGADFAIHPSGGEVGYSLSILEYMRAGLPVIVPDNPSVCEATIDGVTGFVYPEGDLTAASEAICKLLNNDRMREDMGLNAQDRSQQYSLQKTHHGLLEAFSFIGKKKKISRWKA